MGMVPALAEANEARKARLARMGMPQSAPVILPPTQDRPRKVFMVANNCRQTMGNGLSWTDAEVDILLDMAKQKFSARAIATKLRRSPGSIQGKARSLGVVIYMRPSREFVTPLRGEEITRLYKLVVDLDKSSNVRVKGIIGICADQHGITVEDILGAGRAEKLVIARQQAMWLAAKETRLSLPALGKLFDRDHTTVLHAIRRENGRTGENVRGVGVPKR